MLEAPENRMHRFKAVLAALLAAAGLLDWIPSNLHEDLDTATLARSGRG
jgi:hypothetical protein